MLRRAAHWDFEMKINETPLPQPAGKGAQPHTERQAGQWALYDTVMALWPFQEKHPLTPALIEKWSKELTGKPQGIPIAIWQSIINEVAVWEHIKRPLGYLKYKLTQRMSSQP